MKNSEITDFLKHSNLAKVSEDELYGKLQEKTGKSKDDIKSWFDKQMEELD